MTADVWAPLRYGWDHTYWMTIEGIPYVWAEVAHGKTVPTGYTSESATLVIDASAKVGAQIDRDNGIGAGFPLTFSLLDSSALAALTVTPSASSYLTSAITSSATTISVANATSFDSGGGVAWIGKERIAYTGKSGNDLTGCTRATIDYAYPQRADSGAALVTDTPRYWRGRFVTLYALPTDPTGYAPGSTWAADSAVIWRGYLDGEPERFEHGWRFAAVPLDRILARPLIGSLSGELTDTVPLFQVASDDIMIWGQRYDSVGGTTDFKVKLTPFADAGYALGDWIGVSQANAAIKAAWAAEVSAQSLTWLGDMVIESASAADAKASQLVALSVGDFAPLITFKQSASTDFVTLHVYWFGEQPKSRSVGWGSAGNPSDMTFWIGVTYQWNPYNILSNATLPLFALPRGTVRFSQGDPGTIPDAGMLQIGDNLWSYNDVLQTSDAALVQFAGLSPVGHNQALTSAVGASVEVIIADSGTLAAVSLRMLHSSGESGLRDGTYDTLPGIVGYGLPSAFVDQTTLTGELAEGWLGALTWKTSLPDRSFADVVGGALALAGKALVLTDDTIGGDATMRAISTWSAGATNGLTLTDAHVVTKPGASVSMRPARGPNTVTVEFVQGDQTIYTVREIDRPRVAAEGAESVEFALPTEDIDQGVPAAASWALTRVIGDSQISVLEIDCVAWLAVRPGMMLDVSLTHPALWDWASGQYGYQGRARCIGREVSLQTGVQTLTLVLQGTAVGVAISPSAPVSAYAGSAAAPTSIDIPRIYYPMMVGALAALNPFQMLHYEPGDSETTTEYYTFSAVTDTGSVCRLTVASVGGSAVLSASSYLTWPATSDSTSFQRYWMHDGDGSRWT